MAVLMFCYVCSAAGRQVLLLYQRLQPQLLFKDVPGIVQKNKEFYLTGRDFSLVKPVAGQIDERGVRRTHHPFNKIGGPENLHQNP
jgi:hypothetical protein